MQDPFDITADLDTPVSAYLKLAPFGPRYLLESVDNGAVGRYSFIGFGVTREVRVESTPGADPLQPLRRALGRQSDAPSSPALPFAGGLVGAVDFEMAHGLCGLAAPDRGSRPLARFLRCESHLVFDHVTRRVALLHDGGELERARLRREIAGALRGPIRWRRARMRCSAPEAGLERNAFEERVRRAQHHIREGDVYQLVLSVRFDGEIDADPFSVYRALRSLNPSPYLYFVDFGDRQLIGSSPEALVRLTGRRAVLRPIAGTRPRGRDPVADETLERELLEDRKEAAEHVMLVDLARNDLGRIAAPGSVRVDPFREIERYSHVMHLVSGVEGVLPPRAGSVDLFASVFPAGTVSGAPKRRAVELIGELEPGPRGFYAGSVGYFGANGTLDQAITIRTLEIAEGRYAYQAGAGIVADSRPDREHAEVLAKSRAMGVALDVAAEVA